MDERIQIRPIGRVRALDHGRVEIEIAPEFVEALDKIESLDQLWVLYWMHGLAPEERSRLRVHPRGNRSRPVQGVFSLHSPMRPNPIGMTRVRLLKREGNRLVVEGLDALDGSPVLDIKSG